MPSSYNNNNASVAIASQPPTDIRLRLSRDKSQAALRAPTQVGEITREGLERTMARLTTKFRDASANSLAASKSPANFYHRHKLVDQSNFEGYMMNFGDSMHKFLLAEDKDDQAAALTSAHEELDKALGVKPTPTEVDLDYMEMRQQAYAAVLSTHSSVLGFDVGSRSDRTYFHTGKQGEFS